VTATAKIAGGVVALAVLGYVVFRAAGEAGPSGAPMGGSTAVAPIGSSAPPGAAAAPVEPDAPSSAPRERSSESAGAREAAPPAPPAIDPPEPAPREGGGRQTSAWKLEKTRRIRAAVAARLERVERDVTALEASGDAAGAAEQRVLLERLRAQLAATDREEAEYAREAGAGDGR